MRTYNTQARKFCAGWHSDVFGACSMEWRYREAGACVIAGGVDSRALAPLGRFDRAPTIHHRIRGLRHAFVISPTCYFLFRLCCAINSISVLSTLDLHWRYF
jgi:hypothetical protein